MKHFRAEAIPENLNEAMNFVLETVKEQTELSKKIENDILIVCEEVLMNIISYAYGQGTGDMLIDCNFDNETRELYARFSDYGTEFDPLKKEDPDLNVDIMERQIGGLGIFMLKSIADDVGYERKDNMNVLTVKKFI